MQEDEIQTQDGEWQSGPTSSCRESSKGEKRLLSLKHPMDRLVLKLLRSAKHISESHTFADMTCCLLTESVAANPTWWTENEICTVMQVEQYYLLLHLFLMGDCLLNGDIILLKNLHFLFLDPMTTESTIYEPLFLIDEACNLSLKEKRETHFEARRDIFVPRATLLWQGDGFHAVENVP